MTLFRRPKYRTRSYWTLLPIVMNWARLLDTEFEVRGERTSIVSIWN